MDLTKDNFKKEILESKGAALVDFWAEWCGPCIAMKPVMEELAKDFESKARVAKVNVDENQELASEYGVMSIPTLVFFKGGKEVDRLTGSQPKDKLVKKLEELIG